MTRQHNKPAGEARVRHEVKVSQAEEIELQDRAAEAGVTVCRLFVESALGKTSAQRKADNTIRKALLAQLQGIANNVRRMSIRTESDIRLLPRQVALEQLRTDVRAVIAELRSEEQ